MPDAPPRQSREERLAAQLRANLRRRKEQAREMRRSDGAPPDSPDTGLPKPSSPG